MNRILLKVGGIGAWIFVATCHNNTTTEKKSTGNNSPRKGSYAYDRNFLQEHNNSLLELYSEDSTAKVLLSPAWQGRVMTSTAMGDSGASFGWLNYDLLVLKEKRKQFNPVGGEERFWVGPEGGQYAFYFKKGSVGAGAGYGY